MYVKRKKVGVSLLSTFIVTNLIALLIINSISSSAIDVLSAGREVNMGVTSNENAFIGINYEDLYSINKGDEVSLLIQNNLPYTVNYVVDLQCEAFSNSNPINFTINTNGNNQEIKLDTKENINPGIYYVQGTISALFDKGNSIVNINFMIEVK